MYLYIYIPDENSERIVGPRKYAPPSSSKISNIIKTIFIIFNLLDFFDFFAAIFYNIM